MLVFFYIICIIIKNKDNQGIEMNRKKQISQLKIFENVSAKTKETLLQVGSIQEVPKGTFLIRAREAVSTIFFQLAGKSVIYNLTHSGKRKILFVLGPGELLNEHVLNNCPASMYCETIDQSTVLAIPVSEFIKLMAEDFEFAKSILEAQEKKMWRLSHQLKNTASCIYLERKLAAKLWKLSRDFGIRKEDGIEIDINMTITFLADMLGVPRETTSRACSVLMENGLIKIHKKRITITDPVKMSLFFKVGKIE